MSVEICISNFVERWAVSPFALNGDDAWIIIQNAERLVHLALADLDDGYTVEGDIAVHRSATIEVGAILKGPMIVGPRCFVAGSAYLRGGIYLDEDCIVGPGSELKTSFMFKGSKLAHLNFVGDTVLGARANVEAGAIIANYRNELDDKTIRFRFNGMVVDTEVDKFGALVGDDSRIGANAVIAPGAILLPGTKIARLSLVDQYPHDRTQPGL
jgi:NDP-sugar pyrophosphorylase family protein